MGRKSELRQFSLATAAAGPVTRARLLAFLATGFAVGLGLGWLFMGTVHAVSPAAGGCTMWAWPAMQLPRAGALPVNWLALPARLPPLACPSVVP